MQQLLLTGHLGKDAKMKHKEDLFYVTFNIACTDKYTDKEGKTVEKTEWYSIVKKYRNKPEKLLKYLNKGTRVLVQGKPEFSIANTAKGVFINKTLFADKLEISTFKEIEE